MRIQLRHALPADRDALESLIAASARGLGPGFYSTAQIEAALGSAFGVDSQLIADQTYYLALHGEVMVGCGGWSFRATLFGSDRERERNARRLDPATEAARIRAFFVLPHAARQGIGSLILQRCEDDARHMGFQRLALMSTLPGLAFYQGHGYLPAERVAHLLPGEIPIEFVPMEKRLDR